MLMPIKILNLIFERRDTSLWNAPIYINFAIKLYRKIYKSLSEMTNSSALQMIDCITANFIAHFKTSSYHLYLTAFSLTQYGRKKIRYQIEKSEGKQLIRIYPHNLLPVTFDYMLSKFICRSS